MGVNGIASVSVSSLQQYRALEGGTSKQSAVADIKGTQNQPVDTVEISESGRAAYAEHAKLASEEPQNNLAEQEQQQKKKIEETPEYKNAINELNTIQTEVRAHEMAHMAAGGDIAGSATYSYTTGPDGKRYITGGEVPLSIPTTNDKEQKLKDLAQVKKAALAPAEPSSQDLSVAAEASSQMMTLKSEIAKGETDDEKSGVAQEAMPSL